MRELTNRWAWEIGNGSEQRVVISKWWTLNAFRRRVAGCRRGGFSSAVHIRSKGQG